MADLRYPIGKFEHEGEVTAEQRENWIADLAAAPAQLRAAIAGLSREQLATAYRPGGWTVRQVVHHLADSHMNCYIRFKLALTENEPAVKGYDQERWAELEDGRRGPIETSLALLDALHHRWIFLLHSLDPPDFARTFRHSELGLRTLDITLGAYSWHGRHHIAHITSLRQRMGW